MSKVYEGDEWKRCGALPEIPRNRAEEQAHVNALYAGGIIERKEWSDRFDELSNLQLWSAKGRVRK